MLTDDIHGTNLVLHCLEERHASDTYLSWMLDPEVNQYLESRHLTPTVEDLRSYINEMRDSTHSYLFGIFTANDGVHRGNIKLGPISEPHNSAVIGIIIGDKSVWGKGYASEAIGMLTEWAFLDLGLEKLWAGAYAVNQGSVRAFEHNEYTIEGLQRRHVNLPSGERGDVVLLGRLRS